MKVLLVEDDPDQLDVLGYALWRQGYEVLTAADGQQGLACRREHHPDLVLLGWTSMLDCCDVCRQIRLESDTPVILLTAHCEDADIVRGLQVGADDCVPRPFSVKQLAARMEAILRRTWGTAFRQPTREIRIGELLLDLDAHLVTRAGRSVALTRLEFRVLQQLAINEGRVVPYARLIEHAWGHYDEQHAGMLKTHVAHLRRKVGLAADAPGGIRSVTGVGYLLARTAAPSTSGAIGAMRTVLSA
jgi:DNA-binding response OmpR family regulator